LVGAGVTELAEIAKRATTEHATGRTNVDIKLLPGTRNRDRERERHGVRWDGIPAEITSAASGDRHAMVWPEENPSLLPKRGIIKS